MKRNVMAAAVAGVVSATLILGTAIAQGPGGGPGNGRGAGRGPGNGACMGMGPGAGQGAGYGAGGWWNRVTPKTPQQQAFVAQVKGLHEQMRQANLELAALRTRNAPANQIAAQQQQITGIRARIQQTTQANKSLLQQMGMPAGAGACDGTGPKGPGYGRGAGQGMGGGYGMAQGARRGMGRGAGNGMGRGAGNGMGRGLRDGTGPNPDCPLKAN